MKASFPTSSHDNSRHLSALCTRLREIPRESEDYSLSSQDALTQFGLGEPELQALRDARLFGKSAAGDYRYARFDLHYIGLRRGLADGVLTGINFWRASLEQLTRTGGTRVEVSYLPKFSDPAEQVEARVILPADSGHRTGPLSFRSAATFTANVNTTWPTLPDELAAVVEHLATMEFCLLPSRLAGDVSLARQIGFADCWTGSKLLFEACRHMGHKGRIAQGLMIGLPFSSPHTWASVQLEEVWTPVDPLIIELMRRWGGLDPEAWPHHRSPGAMLLPIVWDAAAPIPLVTRNGQGVPTTFLTRIVMANVRQ